MLDYVYGHDQIIAQFVAQLIPAVRDQGFSPASTAIGVIDDEGKLIAGVVYHNYNIDAAVIEMSCAALPGKKWLTKETLRRIYQYPFLQLHCQMVISVVTDDERPLRVLSALGYTFIRFPRLHGRDKDAVVCRLTVEDWASNRITKRLEDAKPQLEEAA